jgi:transaldolase
LPWQGPGSGCWPGRVPLRHTAGPAGRPGAKIITGWVTAAREFHVGYQHDRLSALSAQGVAVWLDDLSRELLAGGELRSLIAGWHVVGITTNPAIFASALAHGDRYDDQLAALASRGASVDEAVLAITTDDVRDACDLLSAVYHRTGGADGRVSIEVDPRLSHDPDATVAMARTLWRAVGRDNLFIKIPATREGLAAITAVTGEGISVNVTLIFSLDRYEAVRDAYMRGLEQALADGRRVDQVRSVASFFVSRVDTEVDARLDRITGGSSVDPRRGTAAMANARLAYRDYEQSLASRRWQRLAAHGAQRQRPLWASTGVKDPACPDTRYVTGLVAPDTVNTMPRSTLAAFADHGEVTGNTITGRYADAERELSDLKQAGIDLAEVTALLEREGLTKFENSWAQLSQAVSEQLRRSGRNG